LLFRKPEAWESDAEDAVLAVAPGQRAAGWAVWLARAGRSFWKGRSTDGEAAGNRTVTVVPSPTLLAIPIVPPHESAIDRQIESPRPPLLIPEP